MSRLAHHPHPYSSGTIVTKALMRDHHDMQRLLDAQHVRAREQVRRQARAQRQAALQAEEDAHILYLAEYYDPYGD